MLITIQDRDGNMHPVEGCELHTLIVRVRDRIYHLREIDGDLQFEAVNAPLVLVPTGTGRVRVRPD
jgi:hypothetical protein